MPSIASPTLHCADTLLQQHRWSWTQSHPLRSISTLQVQTFVGLKVSLQRLLHSCSGKRSQMWFFHGVQVRDSSDQRRIRRCQAMANAITSTPLAARYWPSCSAEGTGLSCLLAIQSGAALRLEYRQTLAQQGPAAHQLKIDPLKAVSAAASCTSQSRLASMRYAPFQSHWLQPVAHRIPDMAASTAIRPIGCLPADEHGRF